MPFTSDVITIERDGPVATVWLDRPEKRNAMGRAFFDDLPGAMADVSDDPEIRAVVIAAKGPHFTVGLDLKEMGGIVAGGGSSDEASDRPATHSAQSRKFLAGVRRLQASITSVENCPKPTIAAVHGYVIGGGVDLIACCDIRLASADALLSVRETKIAIVADLGSLQRLPRIISPGHLAEMAFTGDDIDAERALRIGLVNDIAPDHDGVVKSAHTLAVQIAANSPLVVQGTKEVLRRGRDLTVEQGLEDVAVWNAAFIATNDLTEAMMSFIEKREPDFHGD